MTGNDEGYSSVRKRKVAKDGERLCSPASLMRAARLRKVAEDGVWLCTIQFSYMTKNVMKLRDLCLSEVTISGKI